MVTSAWSYLRFALADEIANTLTYTRSLDVRPSSVTRKYDQMTWIPNARERRCTSDGCDGHYLKQGDKLLVTLEAIDVDSNRLRWQSNVAVPTDDLIALQTGMAVRCGKAYCLVWELERHAR